MLQKLLLALAGGNQKGPAPQKKKKSASELRREKDRRDYALWVMAEEYEEEGED